MRDHKIFLAAGTETEMRPPPAAVIALTLTCSPVKPQVLQNGLFIPLAPEPEKLELLLARLAKLVGPENIGSPELVDTHRPDSFLLKRFALKLRSNHRRRSKTKAIANQQLAIGNRQSHLAFRVFRPPLRAIVQADRGLPTQINAWGPSRSVYGKIVRAAGPWRTSGDWWRADGWARDEWDVAVVSPPWQILYRIYRELRSGVWFVEGVYD